MTHIHSGHHDLTLALWVITGTISSDKRTSQDRTGQDDLHQETTRRVRSCEKKTVMMLIYNSNEIISIITSDTGRDDAASI